MNRIGGLAVGIVFLVVRPGFAQTTSWISPSPGDWNEAANWSDGVPDLSKMTRIDQGAVQFATPANAGTLTLGYAFSQTLDASASLSGINSLTTNGSVFIARAEAFTAGTTHTAIGKLTLLDGDFTSKAETVYVGRVSGTGTNTHAVADAELMVDNGDFTANSLWIAIAEGTGAAHGKAIGHVAITNGNISAVGPVPGLGSVYVGVSRGISQFNGEVEATLDLIGGNLDTHYIRVGDTEPTSSASGKANGRLTVVNGDVSMWITTVGTMRNNGGPAIGLFELFGGTLSGTTLEVGSGGRMVFGIGGTQAGDDYSRALLFMATLNGTVEARFTNAFQPSPGDTFDLISAASITGNYAVNVTGLSPNAVPWKVIRTSSLLRLAFVPEPSSLFLFGSSILLTLRRGRCGGIRNLAA